MTKKFFFFTLNYKIKSWTLIAIKYLTIFRIIPRIRCTFRNMSIRCKIFSYISLCKYCFFGGKATQLPYSNFSSEAVVPVWNHAFFILVKFTQSLPLKRKRSSPSWERSVKEKSQHAPCPLTKWSFKHICIIFCAGNVKSNNTWRACLTLHQYDFTKFVLFTDLFFLYSSFIPFLQWWHHLPLMSSKAFGFHVHHIHVHPLSIFVQRVVLRVFPQTDGTIPLSKRNGKEKRLIKV